MAQFDEIPTNEADAKAIIKAWNQMKQELKSKFENRQANEAEPLMSEGVQLLLHFIYLTNEMADKKEAALESCPVKPVNAEERIQFIRSQRSLYHSYRQLAELFAEQEKLHAKKMALQKLKKKRPD